MTIPQSSWRSTLGVLISLLIPISAYAQPLETLIEWNRLLQVTAASTPTPTVFFTRPYGFRPSGTPCSAISRDARTSARSMRRAGMRCSR